MIHKVVLPELGEGIDSAELACWHTAEGRRVSTDDDLSELVTDKAAFTVPAGADGIIRKIYFKVGDRVRIGETLAEIELSRPA